MTKIDIRDWYNQRRKDWYDVEDMDMQSVKDAYNQNIKALENAASWREKTDRPITITILHGSGRHPTESCAHEMSNSEMLLERGLELALEDLKAEGTSDSIIWRYKLREMMLEPCNGCVSTASALCNFPCSCFPADDITTKIYPAIMASDVLLWSTPVNQSMVSTRVKTVLDRLISLDGGYYVGELPIKDDNYREYAIGVSQEHPRYDQRMFGKVVAYFVSSKDLKNPLEESAPYAKEFKRLGYVDFVIGALSNQGAEYGWFHADPFYAVHVSQHDEEYSYDKSNLGNDEKSHDQARKAVLSSIKLATKFRTEPPKYTDAGRINRT